MPKQQFGAWGNPLPAPAPYVQPESPMKSQVTGFVAAHQPQMRVAPGAGHPRNMFLAAPHIMQQYPIQSVDWSQGGLPHYPITSLASHTHQMVGQPLTPAILQQPMQFMQPMQQMAPRIYNTHTNKNMRAQGNIKQPGGKQRHGN